MAVPTFVSDSAFAVQSSHDPVALFTVSALALAANIAVAVYQVHRIITQRKNPLKDELFEDLTAYRRVVEEIPGSEVELPTEEGEPRATVPA